MRCIGLQEERDRDLMRQVAEGDAAALELLFVAHHPGVVQYLSRRIRCKADVEDLAQTVFLRAHESARRFRGQSSVRTFLIAIARNVCREALLRDSRSLRLAEKRLAFVSRACRYCLEACPADTATAEVCRQEHERRVTQAVACLPEPVREAIRLRIYEGRGVAEAARIAGCTPKTLRRRIGRAMKELRRLLSSGSLADAVSLQGGRWGNGARES